MLELDNGLTPAPPFRVVLRVLFRISPCALFCVVYTQFFMIFGQAHYSIPPLVLSFTFNVSVTRNKTEGD
jgi:hypothetical protein